MTLLQVQNVKKIYLTRFGSNRVEALRDVSFDVEQGEFVAIMGESGSGKTTLLNILAALDKPTSGQVNLDGKSLSTISERHLARFRRENLGFVFQEFNLLDNFSNQDNILLPLVLSGGRIEEMDRRLKLLAEELDITSLLSKFPYEISGGQKQRVAVARALIHQPKLVLADEPTGALDSYAAENLLNLFTKINAQGQTIVMVTHSTLAASHASRVLFIKDGEVFHQMYKGQRSNEEMFTRIQETLTLLGRGGRVHA